MVFDALTHVTPDGRWFATELDAGESALLRNMDAAGVDRAVVVPIAGYIEDSSVAEVCARHPDRLVAGASFDPTSVADPGEVRRAVETSVFSKRPAVLKLHPRFNAFDPLDARCVALLELLAEARRPPVVWLCSLLRHRNQRLTRPPIETFHELAVRFPDLDLVLLHAGGAEALQLAEAVRDFPNVYLDLSWTLWRYRGSSVELDLAFLMRTFDRRLLFGSDFPEVTPGQALEAFDGLASGLDDDRRSRILGGNLERLLGDRAGAL